MTVLKDNPEEVFQLQEGLAAYIQREVLDVPNLNPFQKASNYQKFIKQHEGVLKEVFGKENYNSRFGGDARAFKRNVLDPLEQTNVDIKRLQARFGGLALDDSGAPVLDIVRNILRQGQAVDTERAAANLLDDAQYLKRIADKNPIIRTQIAQVFKRDLLNDIFEAKGAGFELSAKKLNRLINEGFGPEQISGPRLTFESLVLPLLGKKDGKAFVKNIKVLNSVLQRVQGVGRSDVLKEGLESIEKTNIFLRLLQRIFLSPISKESRRTSVMINTASSRSRTFVGRMLLDPELFESSMRFAQGKESLQKFITMLTAHSSVEARDLGNELKYYDRINKEQTEDKQDITTNPIDPSVRPNIPDRVLDLSIQGADRGAEETKDIFNALMGYFNRNDDDDADADDNDDDELVGETL